MATRYCVNYALQVLGSNAENGRNEFASLISAAELCLPSIAREETVIFGRDIIMCNDQSRFHICI